MRIIIIRICTHRGTHPHGFVIRVIPSKTQETEFQKNHPIRYNLGMKECVHTQLHEAQDVKVNFGVFEQHTDAMKQQSELIEHWVKKEEEYARKEAQEKG